MLAIRPQSRELFDSICERERCPYAILGEATDVRELVVNDPLLNIKGDQQPVDMPLQVLLGGTPKCSVALAVARQHCKR